MTKEQLRVLEDLLWDATDNLRSNSDLTIAQYSTPVLGIIFEEVADSKYTKFEAEINAEYENLLRTLDIRGFLDV